MVPTEGVEPTHPLGYQILSLARLPIPPHRPPIKINYVVVYSLGFSPSLPKIPSAQTLRDKQLEIENARLQMALISEIAASVAIHYQRVRFWGSKINREIRHGLRFEIASLSNPEPERSRWYFRIAAWARLALLISRLAKVLPKHWEKI
jgi:hypothetical protein